MHTSARDLATRLRITARDKTASISSLWQLLAQSANMLDEMRHTACKKNRVIRNARRRQQRLIRLCQDLAQDVIVAHAAPVAQLDERRDSNAKDAGSSPARSIIE